MKIIQSTSQQAFAMIEILISISIIGIICAISLSSVMSFYQRLMDEMLLSQLLHTLAFAHQEALIQGVPVGICKSKNHVNCMGEWKDGQIVFIDTFSNGSVRNKEQVLAIRYRIKQSGSLHYRAFPFYRDYLLFTSRGWLGNDNGTFWYCPQKSTTPTWAILLTKSGKTRVIYPDKNGDIKDSHGQNLPCEA